MPPTRRDFLKGAVGVAGAAVGSPLMVGGNAAASSTPNLGPISIPSLRAMPGISPVEHVVVVMMENRSFDHFMGWMPGANGIGVDPEGKVVDEERFASFSFTDAKGKVHGIHHEKQLNGCGLGDQDHGYTGGRIQWNKGSMDGFALDPQNSAYALSYYLASQRSFTSPLAMNYTTCDNYFCSILGPTWPNRFFQHAAQTDRIDNNLNPEGSSLPVAVSTVPTIWDRLNQPGGPTGRYYFSDVPFTALWGAKYLPISEPYPAFLVDAAAGTLPNVSFVDPRFEDEGSGTSGDDHPLADIRAGDAFLSEIFHALANGPLWSKTVMIINYDEWGGFFDHVAPPWAAPGNQTIDTLDVVRGGSGKINKVLTGFRVPCIIASPFTKGSPDKPRLTSYAYDHSSVLRFIQWNWGLDPLTPRDASTPMFGAWPRHLTSLAFAFDFVHPDFSVPDLPELLPFVSTGCDIPGSPAPTRPPGEWAELKASELMKGWI